MEFAGVALLNAKRQNIQMQVGGRHGDKRVDKRGETKIFFYKYCN